MNYNNKHVLFNTFCRSSTFHLTASLYTEVYPKARTFGIYCTHPSVDPLTSTLIRNNK